MKKWNIFKMFNMQFDELHQRQFLWTVPYTELTESLRLAVAEKLLGELFEGKSVNEPPRR
ncbi:hypothetical protein HID58_050121 [Brassica napus]|uniref:Exocyst complex subunit Exo70 C-terminal domain-containing protein n=1 Tax=Brassica napus TaxID=3708 RepID=A0ABQ8A5T2_BRANA|nr:hypothetical protein HID58_050121 [Brassica napus]